jgi:hypothetical protein
MMVVVCTFGLIETNQKTSWCLCFLVPILARDSIESESRTKFRRVDR